MTIYHDDENPEISTRAVERRHDLHLLQNWQYFPATFPSNWCV